MVDGVQLCGSDWCIQDGVRMIHYSHFAIRWCIKLFHLRLIDGKNYCVGIIPKSHFAILDGTKSYFFKLWIIHQKTVLRTTPKKEQQTKSPPRQIRKSRNLSKSLGSENIHATSYSCRKTSMLNGGQENCLWDRYYLKNLSSDNKVQFASSETIHVCLI